MRSPPSSTLFPYTTLFRSDSFGIEAGHRLVEQQHLWVPEHRGGDAESLFHPERERSDPPARCLGQPDEFEDFIDARTRSEEHTSELQSLRHLVCRLLLEKQ